MKDGKLIGAVAALLFTWVAPAQGGILFYNGDYDGRDGLSNERGVNVNAVSGINSTVYENFIVPAGQTWTITSAFSNNAINFAGNVSTATYEIRSALSSGSPGTLVAGGVASATETLVTATVPGTNFPEYTTTANIATPVVLTSGTYWVAVAPNDSNPGRNDQSYVLTTSGTNSIGQPAGNDGNSYITNTVPAGSGAQYYFTPTSTAESNSGLSGTFDYSLGVVGTATAVPEPAAFALLGLGALGLGAIAARRRARA